MRREISGLYAVTPDTMDTKLLVEKVKAALDGGARLVQYRNKAADESLQRAQARALLALCRPRRIPLIINDHLELALDVNADGLHVGKDDGSIRQARERLGPGKLLGASCYNSVDAALEAVRSGADHVAFGSFFPSASKPGAVRAPVALLKESKRRLSVPVVAIGGITPDNAAELVGAGADAVAVIAALFEAPDPVSTARRFSELFEMPGAAPAAQAHHAL